MPTIAEFMARDQPETLCVPDVSGMTCGQAAVEYAKAGFVIVPIDPTTKNAGSIVGDGWHGKASRSPDMARLWWREHPNAGIGIVTGHSGVLVFDLDVDEIPAELTFLKTAAIHLSRPGGSQRGHYVFKTFETFTNSRVVIDGKPVADIRSGNTIFVVEPTPHSKGGSYHWDTSYAIPELPAEAREYLKVSQARAGGDATSEEVANFEALYSSGPQPMVIDAIVETTFGASPDDTRNALRDALCWAARESKGGRYGWRDALDKIHKAAVQSYANRGRTLSDAELGKLTAYAIGEVRDQPERELWLRWQSDETKQAIADSESSPWAGEQGKQPNQRGKQPDWMDDDSAGLDLNEPRNSWSAVDMTTAMAKGEVHADLGARSDGAKLLYSGRVHWFFGSFESGKTWAALFLAAQELNNGNRVLYLDFEDDASGIGQRLQKLGVPLDVILDPLRFSYIRPDESLRSEASRNAFEATLTQSFTLAVLDGVTESIALEDLKDNQGGDVATWLSLLPRKVADRTGAATICLDHVPKDTDNQAMPVASQHKMNGLTGAAYRFVSVEKFGKTKRGQSNLRVHKDRPGDVRGPLGVDYDPKDGSHLIGHFVMDARDPQDYRVAIHVPKADDVDSVAGGTKALVAAKPKEPQDRLWCMERLVEYLLTDLSDTDRGQNKVVRHMHARVKGKGRTQISESKWRDALRALVTEHYVFQLDGPKAARFHFGFQPWSELTELTIERREALAKQAEAKLILERTETETDE